MAVHEGISSSLEVFGPTARKFIMFGTFVLGGLLAANSADEAMELFNNKAGEMRDKFQARSNLDQIQ